jgi:hypothetical protein
MKKNVHPIERIIRVVVGVGLISMAFVGPANPLFFLGVVPLLTGLMGSCPAYTIFGFSTCNLGKANTK